MTQKQEIQERVRKLLSEIDDLYAVHGQGDAPSIDTKFMESLYDNSKFLIHIFGMIEERGEMMKYFE